MAGSNAHVCLLGKITRADECAFIRPVHEVLPVGFMVLEELTIELQVLPNLDNYVIGLDGWIPSARTEGKSTYGN